MHLVQSNPLGHPIHYPRLLEDIPHNSNHKKYRLHRLIQYLLAARVKALLKRCNIVSSQIAEAGRVTIDRNRYLVETESGSITLPLKEFELLFLLAGSPGRTFSRDRLIEEIWGYDFDGNERTLDVHVNRLRDRFPSNQYGFKITTIRGVGYRLEEIK